MSQSFMVFPVAGGSVRLVSQGGYNPSSEVNTFMLSAIVGDVLITATDVIVAVAKAALASDANIANPLGGNYPIQ